MGVKETTQSRIFHFRIIHSRETRSGITGSRITQSQVILPAAMILIGIVSVQFGAGLADRLFAQIPPAAVTGLRLWTSAVAMVALSGRGLLHCGA